MKKTLLFSALTLAAAAMYAGSPEDYRYYINPGHGSWTGNDRPVQTFGHGAYSATNTDTTGFFESNTDLIKGFGVLETLIKMGVPFDRTLNQTGERWEIGAAKDLSQNIVMSRVKNGPFEANNTTSSPNYMQYNRSLPEIAAEVEYNEFDIFISIHSNAAKDVGASTNYHLYMYRGRNGIQNVAVQGSWEMIEAGAKYSFANQHASWSASYTYINGDVDFMGGGSGSTNSLGYFGYLGVMKHGCPGYLVEGYFHTYLPSTHRGMNFDVDFEEGCYYGRGVAEYFEFNRTSTGDIYGIVRDQHEKFTHKLYQPRVNSEDVYKPLNGVKVNLLKDGVKVAEYTTDQNYNGAYLFFDVEPGDYTITYEHPDYKATAPVPVTVVAGDCVYPKTWLESTTWIAPDDLKETYPDELGDNTAYGAHDSYNFTNLYTDKVISELDGKTIRRTFTKGDRLYVLALDADNNPTIVVYDLVTNKVLATPSTAGMDGTELNCSDIQITADGILVACNKEKLQYADSYIQEGDKRRGTLTFYRWENDLEGVPVGDPVPFITTQNSSLWYRTFAGDTFSYEGTMEDGTITVSNPTISAPNHQLRTLEIAVVDGAKASESLHKPLEADGTGIFQSTHGEGYRFIPSPLDKRKVWMVSSKAGILELDNDIKESPTAMQVSSVHEGLVNATGATAFKYAGHSYLAVPVTVNGAHAGVTMYDVTAGLDQAVATETVGTDIEASETGNNCGAAGITVTTRNKDTNVLTDAHIKLTTLRNHKVSRFTTQNTAQNLQRAPYAYALQRCSDKDAMAYTLSFNLTGDAASAALVLTPTDGTEEIVTDLGSLSAGHNSATVACADLEEGKTYNWAVRVNGPAVHSAGRVMSGDAVAKAKSRGGLTWIADTESPNYGKLVTSAGYAQGITVYNPELDKEGTYTPAGNAWVASKVNSPFRMGTKNGNVYLADWSDAAAGYWFFDPSNPETTYDALGGTRENSGAHTYNGTNIGGGSTCVAFQGSGDDAVMYSFSEDFPTGNGTMTLIRQKVGNATTWTETPVAFGGISASKLMKGTNVEIIALPDGIFVSQVRAEGKNIETEPAFVYVDNAGNVKFNSATLGDDLTSCGSGIAISQDMSTLAVAENTTGIGIWDVEWTDNTPSLTKRYVIPGSAGSDEVNQLSFDAAGNLYAWHRTASCMSAYTIKNAAPVAVTNAPAALTLDAQNGVENITVDTLDANAPVEYYNLNGVRISNPTPGTLVIRRQGNNVTKVIVK